MKRQGQCMCPHPTTDLRELVQEASEIMQITYAGNFPAGIESFLVRAQHALTKTAPAIQGEDEAMMRQAVHEYLEHLRSSKPLNEQFKAIKCNIVTLACIIFGSDVDRGVVKWRSGTGQR